MNYANEQLKEFEFEHCYYVDFIIDAKDMNNDFLKNIADLRFYWGKGFEESLIAIENLKITSDNLILMSPDKNPTWKITHNNISYIRFGTNQDEFQKLQPTKNGSKNISIIGKAYQNIWNGNISYQIIVEDYLLTEEKKYDF